MDKDLAFQPESLISTDLVDNGIKGSLVSTISDDGDTNVSPKLIRTVHAQLVFNGDDILSTSVGRKEEFWFAVVYFLAGTVVEGIKNSFDGDAILLGCLSKEDQVISEEKMHEWGAISRGFHSSLISKSDLRVYKVNKVLHA